MKMKNFYRGPPNAAHNSLYVVYARVLLQMLEDMERSGTDSQASAISWFSTEPYEVAIVCGICGLKPRQLYREVARRLIGTKLQSKQIRFIRLELGLGTKLSDIVVLPVKAVELVAA